MDSCTAKRRKGCVGPRVLVLVAALVCLACGAVAGEVARVGSRVLTSDDLELRCRVEQVYRSGAQVTSATAAVILLQETMAAEAARLLGVDATTTECEGLARYADSTSQAPDLLAKVKAVFGADRAAYLRLYIAPKVVEQKLRGTFVHSRELHKEQIRAIEAAMAEARATSASLAQLAVRHKLEFTTFSLSEEETSGPQGLPVRLEFRKDPMLELVRPLKPGELYANIVENDEEFRVVRLVEHEATTTHTLESLVARKRPYQEWLREHLARVPIVVFDRALAGEIRQHYPSLAWWAQVRVSPRGNEK